MQPAEQFPHYIEFRHLYKTFDRPVLVDSNFYVNAGETVAIIGRSGVGKSVTLSHIMGFLKPDQGRVIVAHQDITDMEEAELRNIRRKVTMVFQNGALFDSLTIGENVGYSLIEHGHMPLDEVESRVRTMLKRVGLDPEVILDGLPAELSLGMQRRVAIARAVAASDPLIMLYDEPTTGLDPISVETITDIIVRLRQELHVSGIVVTHEIPHALKVGNRFLFLYDRRVAFEGSAEELADSNVPELVRFLAPFKISLAQAFQSFSEGNGT